MPDAGAIARKLDFMRADIDEPGSSPAARLIAGHAALLVAAVEAATSRHRPVIRKEGHPAMCEWDNRRWPGPEVADIARALNGDTDD